MKIAVASDDGQTIAMHFGRTNGFVVYRVDEEGNVIEDYYMQNRFTGHVTGESGHTTDKHATILEALSGCKAVIARGMGRRIYMDLQSAGIEPFIVKESIARQALNLYLNNALKDNPDKGCDH